MTLGAVATFAVVGRSLEIQRENRKVRATCEGEGLQDVRQRIEEMMNAFDLPGATRGRGTTGCSSATAKASRWASTCSSR